MITKENALEFTRQILADQPEADAKFEFLQKHTEDRMYWPLLRCFLVGMDCQTVDQYVRDHHPTSGEEISQWMLEVLAERLRDRDKVYAALQELQTKVENNRLDHDAYEKNLKELQKTKLDLKNVKQTVIAKDQMIQQLQEKLQEKPKECVPTVGTTSGTATKESHKDLSLEAFKYDVLLNSQYTKQQKDYLLSLMEQGASYSDINMIANPGIELEDMQRFYQLLLKQRTRHSGSTTVQRIKESGCISKLKNCLMLRKNDGSLTKEER